ncbi:MAG: hypothetical protein ACXVXW_07575, partial [Mycobacteriaceae bacterium]
MTDAERQQARTGGAREERIRWEQALADSHLPNLYKRLVRDLAMREAVLPPGDDGVSECLTVEDGVIWRIDAAGHRERIGHVERYQGPGEEWGAFGPRADAYVGRFAATRDAAVRA